MPPRTLDRAVAAGLAALAVLCPERTLAEVANARNLPQQLATLLDEAVVIGAGHVPLHLSLNAGNRHRSGTKAFLNLAKSGRAPGLLSWFAKSLMNSQVEHMTHVRCKMKRRAPSAERRAPSAERRAPSAERRAPSAERRAPSAERRAPSAERRAPSAERRAPSASCEPQRPSLPAAGLTPPPRSEFLRRDLGRRSPAYRLPSSAPCHVRIARPSGAETGRGRFLPALTLAEIARSANTRGSKPSSTFSRLLAARHRNRPARERASTLFGGPIPVPSHSS